MSNGAKSETEEVGEISKVYRPSVNSLCSFVRRTTDKIVILSPSQKWQGMALFSFRHSVKTFSPKCGSKNRRAITGQTAAHLRYITRASAAREVVRKRLDFSSDSEQANAAETIAKKRKGRVCERFIVALPVEASADQKSLLARKFAEEITDRKAGYILAVHDKAGNDRSNPHFHLVVFDQHISNGGRGRPRSVVGMARKNAVQSVASRWAEIHNVLMRQWGYGPESFISSLSFADRGLDRVPEIHEGPASRRMKARGANISSKPEWERIDAGRSRADANILIRQINNLNEEINNAPNNRLGSRDRVNQSEIGGSCTPLGESRRSIVGDADETRCAVKNAHGDQQETEALRGPPWLAGKVADRFRFPFAGTSKPKSKQLPHPTDESISWPDIGVGRVRRVFVELTILRDTLLTRLATLRGRRLARSVGGHLSPQQRSRTQQAPLTDRRAASGPLSR